MEISQRSILTIIAFALAVCASMLGLRQNQNAQTAAREQQPSAPDLGSISGNEYTNDSLGITYEFPKNWFVDRGWVEAQNKPVDLGLRPSDPDQAARYDAMVGMRKGTFALLAVSERPPDEAKGSARIQLSVSPVFENKTGAEILSGMKASYSQMRLVQIEGDPVGLTFGGQTFSRMDMRLLDVILRGGAGFQSALIGVRDGRYLQFAMLANSQEQLDALVHSLDSLRFK